MKETASMRIGTMVHTWLLENHRFNNDYAIDPNYAKPEKPCPDMRKASKEDKESFNAKVEAYNSAVDAWTEANEGKVIIKQEEIDKFKHITPYSNTTNELTVLFDFLGVKCKARFDTVHPNGIEDLKTTVDIFKVERAFNNFSYYIQAGFYQAAFQAAFGKLPDFFHFTFISTNEFVVKETFVMEFAYMEYARDKATELVLAYKECLEKDEWPLGLDTELTLPHWL
jgi:hypothetical protein